MSGIPTPLKTPVFIPDILLYETYNITYQHCYINARAD